MRVEIENGKLKGWMKVREAAEVLCMSVGNLRMKINRKNIFAEKDVLKLYGNVFVRESAVKKLAKKQGKLEKE